MQPGKQATESWRKEIERSAHLLLGGEHELQPGAIGGFVPAHSVLQLLEATVPREEDRALFVGLPNSFLVAVYARLVRDVLVLVRRSADRAALRRQLAQLPGGNVRVRADRALHGWEEHGPFDLIFVGQHPGAELGQLQRELAIGGRLLLMLRGTGELVRPVLVQRTTREDFVTEQLPEVSLRADLDDLLTLLDLIEAPVLELARQQGGSGEHLGTYLVERGLLPEKDLCFVRALHRGLGHAPLERLQEGADLAVIRSMPRTYLQHQGILPLRFDDDTVIVAIKDPDVLLEELAPAFHPRRLAPYLVSDSEYHRLWLSIDLMIRRDEDRAKQRPAAPDAAELAKETESAWIEVDTDEGHKPAEDSSPGSMLHFSSLLLDAVSRRASDIHLEFTRLGAQIRLRIDGGLVPYDGFELSPGELVRLVNVFKIRAKLDISERRVPQGGGIRLRVHKSQFDLRLQTQPTLFGENAVVRILPQDARVQTIEELGFPQDEARIYTRVLQNPSGLVLVVGPTGSGKSTTLYAGLLRLSEDSTRKIVTIEDPIEYCLTRVQQSQVNTAAGFHFSSAIRSFLRQDPDVMLVGEIRDGETAREAIRASQTGHLVLSTLHCNESTDAVQRLGDLGQDVPSIASELRGVVAQRLARRICKSCRIESVPDRELLALVFPDGAPRDLHTWRGQGCARCGGTGVHGRISVVEFLLLDDELQERILEGVSSQQLRRMALAKGMVPMRERALEHVRSGVIAFEDLPRFLPMHRLAPEH